MYVVVCMRVCVCLEYVGYASACVYLCECVFNNSACFQVGLNQVSTSWTSRARGARSYTHGVLPDDKLTLNC